MRTTKPAALLATQKSPLSIPCWMKILIWTTTKMKRMKSRKTMLALMKVRRVKHFPPNSVEPTSTDKGKCHEVPRS
jgi:hypothetical protein